MRKSESQLTNSASSNRAFELPQKQKINLSAISVAFANFIYKSRQLTIEMIVCGQFWDIRNFLNFVADKDVVSHAALNDINQR